MFIPLVWNAYQAQPSRRLSPFPPRLEQIRRLVDVGSLTRRYRSQTALARAAPASEPALPTLPAGQRAVHELTAHRGRAAITD